jgi:hypothetical protein
MRLWRNQAFVVFWSARTVSCAGWAPGRFGLNG